MAISTKEDEKKPRSSSSSSSYLTTLALAAKPRSPPPPPPPPLLTPLFRTSCSGLITLGPLLPGTCVTLEAREAAVSFAPGNGAGALL
jgi:hypothetical protein